MNGLLQVNTLGMTKAGIGYVLGGTGQAEVVSNLACQISLAIFPFFGRW
jgi:hypothetical protein